MNKIPTIFKSAQVNRYSIQTKMHQGVKHMVVPVVMMVEGVHNGSHGAVFHSAEELSKFTEAWNGIPVVIQHPERDGRNVSANSPDVVDDELVGRVYNTCFEDGKLKAEVWLNEELLEGVSTETLEYIQQGRALDVSVGVFTDDEAIQGDWRGETYTSISRNHRPDHLALLPGAVGACSWADGCGIRANKKGGDSVDVKEKIKVLKEFFTQELKVNEVGQVAVLELIRSSVDSLDSQSKMNFLEEVYKGHYIYRMREVKMVDGNIQREGQTTLYKQDYKIENDQLVLEGSPIEVVKEVKYKEKVITMKRTKGGIKTMADEKICCPEKVEALIQSNVSTFTEDDREWLSVLSEGQLDKLVAADTDLATFAADLEKANETIKNNKKEKDKEPQMNKEDALKVLKEELADPNKFLSLLPKEIQGQMSHGLRLHDNFRAELITNIKAATDVYSDDELNDMETSSLEKLAKLAKPQAIYVGQGGNQTIEINAGEDVLLPVGVSVTK